MFAQVKGVVWGSVSGLPSFYFSLVCYQFGRGDRGHDARSYRWRYFLRVCYSVRRFS